jgi:hypothetical protein
MAPIAMSPKARYFACFAYRKCDVQGAAPALRDIEATVAEARVTDAPFRLSKPNGVARFGPLSVKRVCLLTALGSSSDACRNPAPSPSVER